MTKTKEQKIKRGHHPRKCR